MKNEVMLERSIKYNGKTVTLACQPLLVAYHQSAILFHAISTPFEMKKEDFLLKIPKGSYTIAFYWQSKPYNIYLFKDDNHQLLGFYINIVKNTSIDHQSVTFQDLIIDIAVMPNGEFTILDEEELPCSLDEYENGTVKQALLDLQSSLPSLINKIKFEASKFKDSIEKLHEQ
ncbi:hypothetical protein BTS2_2066 [Bacillus sp. TS-2]|nr:hypothetical protein BTS2_2066 [Bacillus sp. TS-2]